MAKSKKKSKEDEVVINLDKVGIPVAILISAILIALAIFFASRNFSPTNTEDTGSGAVPSVEEAAEEFEEASATLGDAAVLGDRETATVAIVEYSYSQCGYCQRHFEETFPDIKTNYIDTGKILYAFKAFPLADPGDLGYSIAEGASCIYSLSNAKVSLEYHKGSFSLNSVDDIIALAEKLGVDGSKVKTCLDEGTFRDAVEKEKNEGVAAGIQGTPGFVVGLIGKDGAVQGSLIAGAYPYETFVETIEALLE